MKFGKQKTLFSNNSFILLQNESFLKNQRVAGKVASDTLKLLKQLVEDKTTKSLKELDEIGGEFITKNGCELTFKGYKGFGSNFCHSVNKQLVHGLATDYVLQDGDLVTFDLGATFEGAVADTARTFIYGTPKSEQHIKLIKATEDALDKSIEAIKIGKRIGVIGETIYKHGKGLGLSVITAYGGHGISISEDGKGIPHAQPFICNRAESNQGVRFAAGMTLAIEPLFVLGPSTTTKVLDDHWTVVADDICSHHEKTIYIHEDSVEIITPF